MNNVDIFISHDVTGSLIFGKEYEVFTDYLEVQENEKVFWRDKEDIILSKGASETTRPLPILSALAKNFLSAYHAHPEDFSPRNDPDKHIIPGILTKTIEDLKLDHSHVEETSWVYPEPITNGEYLFQNDLTENAMIFPLTYEIMDLITHSSLFYKGSRSMESEFRGLLTEYIDHILYLSDIKQPGYLMNQRIKELTFKPVGVRTNYMSEIQHSFAVSGNAGILSLAWAEFYSASVYEIPFSICTYCGQVYRFTKNLHKSTCDNISCRKTLRKDRDQQKREENPDDERTKDRLRQQRLRDKKKVKELYQKGKNIEEIRSYLNNKAKKRGDSSSIRTIDEIKRWLR